ncbi:MAG: hypothetical protein FJX72_06370, partial [Armatimonadetes bacterium]|nr:hypothetical protein [Armatimonadota bacterium]
FARGARIRGGTIEPVPPDVLTSRPEEALGPSAASLPLLQHTDPARTLMACNLMRQWLKPPDPEPALVQTGLEPDDPAFWCGRNMLTAYVSMGIDTYEDSLCISETAAARLGYPEPLEVGDKLSNRSGNKGIVTRIVPDADMPRLESGVPVDLAMSPNSIYSRMTIAQLREAVLSWVARQRGEPHIAPPLSAPTRSEMEALMAEADMPPDGMVRPVDGRTGRPFPERATVGWVYWGKLIQTARRAYFASARLAERSQRWGEPEFHALRLAGAHEAIRSLFGSQSSDAAYEASRAPSAPARMPLFGRLQRRMARAGICAQATDGGIRYSFQEPDGDVLRLARGVPHPWLPEHSIETVGAAPRDPAFHALARANLRVERMMAASAPPVLLSQAREELREALARYLDGMVRPTMLRLTARNGAGGRMAPSGRAVAAPAGGLAPTQLGIPDDMAWTLFEPLLSKRIGAGDIAARTPRATSELDGLMAERWVLVHRHPTTGPSSILAFHPVRTPERVVRIHPMACITLNADFDGDVLGVVLPLSDAAQEEAGRTLTLAAHIEAAQRPGYPRRSLYEGVFGPMAHQVRPTMDSRFGLARLCMTEEGRRKVGAIAGVPVPLQNDMLTTAGMCTILDAVLAARGAEALVSVAARLWDLGFEAARDVGPSLTPFPHPGVALPSQPGDDDPDAWAAYQDECQARIMAGYEARVGDTDPARVTLLSGARGTPRLWTQVVGVRGLVRDASDGLIPIRHSVSEGLTPEETLVAFVGMRYGLRGSMYWVDMQREMRTTDAVEGRGVLERALRSKRPGLVFARAAAAEEVDPLDTPRARLLAGPVSAERPGP